ncbi:hypothetical protein CROQUDRAFT_99949 [Cronartium quercuum f. sp. fusiforme G11]|uniref:Uncharacterized protein n=1 Tax=Cronartium quercuum f. sp. fusiforme G11 TaxID=708437 RepID=A0A9P6T686_9BASI|nr:hypothetical protein CROQUDRAFT_99949 [Cronartium quercuum f. sp. fusiforme G11]
MKKELTAHSGETNCSKAFKNYKPTRVAHLERVIRVASNSTGAFLAICEDAILNKIWISSPAECCSLPSTLVCLLSHLKNCADSTPELYTIPPHQLSNKVDDTHTLNYKDEDVNEEEDGLANTDHELGQD